MGIFTRLTVRGIRKAGEGSYFGKCDVCSLPASETFVGNSYPVYKKDALDSYYLGGAFGGGTYGHEKCIRAGYPDALDESTLSRSGNLKMLPMTDVREIIAIAHTVGDYHPYRRDMADAENAG